MDLIVKESILCFIKNNKATFYALSYLKENETILIEGVNLKENYEKYSNINDINEIKKEFNLNEYRKTLKEECNIIIPFPSYIVIQESKFKNLKIDSSKSKITLINNNIKNLEINSMDDNVLTVGKSEIENLFIKNFGDSELFFEEIKVDFIKIIDAGRSDLIFKKFEAKDGIIVPFESDFGFGKDTDVKNVKVIISN